MMWGWQGGSSWGGGWGWGGWLAMSLMMLAFWGLLAWVVVVLVRGRDHNVQSVSPRPPSPEEIASERFARGEIDADEYRERLEALRGHPPQAGT